jgi:LL-diaminopimelate aminotransferase
MQSLPSNFFADIEARVAAMLAGGQDVIRLDVGSPDLPPPPAVIATLERSARSPDHHGYQPHLGPQRLRQAWAEMYHNLYGVDLDPERQVLPLLGSKEGIFNFTQAWVGPGDVVLTPDPGYMTYARAAAFAGAEVYPLPLLPERGFLPDLEAVPQEVARRARLLWLNYPNNPTAAVADRDFMASAVAFARQHDLWLCHDAAYARVTFDGYRAPSVLEIPGAGQVAVEFNSLSKSHNMAGWRVGAALGNSEALGPLFRLKSNLDSGHFLPVMEAAVTALGTDQSWLDERNRVYQGRRDIVVPALRDLGLEAAVPQGSIYVWGAVPPGHTGLEFVKDALEGACVSLTPGAVFGEQGEGYVRLALTAGTERLEEAMRRLAEWRRS